MCPGDRSRCGFIIPVLSVCCVLSACDDLQKGEWLGRLDALDADDVASDIHDLDFGSDGSSPDASCTPSCGGRVCGPDPVCGRSCGKCDAGWRCDAGSCVDDCAGLSCGVSPLLGYNCGTCGQDSICKSGACVAVGAMIRIPAGTFWMGCNSAVEASCQLDETPYHEVALPAYYIDRTEVTQGAYNKCLEAGACEAPGCNWYPVDRADKPVECVNWSQAAAYCGWAGKRLPTEAEWEYAARGPDGRRYAWGSENATCEYAVMDEGGDGCGTNGTMNVCSKSPGGDSPYGLCDMSGNVWEWVSDWYDSGYYENSPSENPQGPSNGNYGIRRGGSYSGNSLGVFTRDDVARTASGLGLGFRCGKS